MGEWEAKVGESLGSSRARECEGHSTAETTRKSASKQGQKGRTDS